MVYTKYDVNAANNTNPPPNGAPEGMVPSVVNDTIRDIMAEIRLLGDSIADGTLPGSTTPIPVASGGTGGTTQATARTGIDVYSKAEADANYLPAIPAKVLTSDTGPTDALPGADMPYSFSSRPTLGMYSPLAAMLAFSAGDHTKRVELSQTEFNSRVPFKIQNSADKETSRVNQSLYSRNQIETLIANLEPIGTIKLWTGLVANIPAGYNLCDGNNGTINLVGKFVRGTDEAGLGTTGGNDAQTVTFSNMAAAGSHDHGGLVNGHALSVAELPAHNHTVPLLQRNFRPSNETGFTFSEVQPGNTNTSSVGSGSTHNHGVPNQTDHTHAGTQVLDNQPAFYQLMYIQKTSIVLVAA